MKPLSILLLWLVVVGTLAGCGGDTSSPPVSTRPLSPRDYVSRVQEMLHAPGRLASLAVPRVATPPAGRVVSRAEVDGLVARARRDLDERRARPIADPALSRQRDAFAGAYQATVTHMERVGRAMVQDDAVRLRRDLPPLLNSMRGLSSAVSPQSS